MLRLERLYSIFASNFKIKKNITNLGETNKQTKKPNIIFDGKVFYCLFLEKEEIRNHGDQKT